jgi:hypothetical protein
VPTIIERLHQLGVGRRTLGVELEGWAETYGNWKSASCRVPSASVTMRRRQPVHPFDVFHS